MLRWPAPPRAARTRRCDGRDLHRQQANCRGPLGALASAPAHPRLQRAQPQSSLRGEFLLRQAARIERFGDLEPLLLLNLFRHSGQGPPRRLPRQCLPAHRSSDSYGLVVASPATPLRDMCNRSRHYTTGGLPETYARHCQPQPPINIEYHTSRSTQQRNWVQAIPPESQPTHSESPFFKAALRQDRTSAYRSSPNTPSPKHTNALQSQAAEWTIRHPRHPQPSPLHLLAQGSLG